METNYNFKANLSQNLYFIRGIAIVLVVIGHVIGQDKNVGLRQMYNSDIFFLTWLSEFIYTFHMPIFFILSGLSFGIFSNKNTGYLAFFKSKVKRLFVPLLCWVPILFIFQSLSKGAQFNLINIINSVIHPWFIFWFFHALFFASVFCFVFLKSFNSQLIYFLVSIGLLVLSFYFPKMHIYLYFNIFYAFGLYIGRYLPNSEFKLKKLPINTTLLMLCFWAAMMLTINYFFGINYNLLTKLVNGIVGFIFLYTVAVNDEFAVSLKPLKRMLHLVKDNFVYLGKISMTIYLLHIPFGSGTRLLLLKVFETTNVGLHFLMGCMLAILGPVVIYHFLHSRSKIFMYSIGEGK